MKKVLRKYGGIFLFYAVIILGIILLNYRVQYLDNHNFNSQVLFEG